MTPSTDGVPTPGMTSEARLLQRLVNELRDIDEAYWTHRLFILVDEADALLAQRELSQ